MKNWTIPLIIIFFAFWSIYAIYKKDKFKVIINDFHRPEFLIIFLVMIGIIIHANLYHRDQKTRVIIRNSVIAAVSAYFGHLDLPMAAFFIAGLFIYYTYQLDPNVDTLPP
jgi:hypothetical protein